MNAQPDQCHIDHALRVAAKSPCRSKRGVVLYNATTGATRGEGWNGPPDPLTCPGRERCAGNCGQRSVHAEVRALHDAARWGRYHDLEDIELLHVELAAGGRVVACNGPSCPGCAAQVFEAGFVRGVWLYEEQQRERCQGGYPGGLHCYTDCDRRIVCPICGGSGWLGPEVGAWRRYTAEEFYRVTLENCGLVP